MSDEDVWANDSPQATFSLLTHSTDWNAP